jgi:hypothetical protein
VTRVIIEIRGIRGEGQQPLVAETESSATCPDMEMYCPGDPSDSEDSAICYTSPDPSGSEDKRDTFPIRNVLSRSYVGLRELRDTSSTRVDRMWTRHGPTRMSSVMINQTGALRGRVT